MLAGFGSESGMLRVDRIDERGLPTETRTSLPTHVAIFFVRIVDRAGLGQLGPKPQRDRVWEGN